MHFEALREELLLAVFVTLAAFFAFFEELPAAWLSGLYLQRLFVHFPLIISDPHVQNSATVNHPFCILSYYIIKKPD